MGCRCVCIGYAVRRVVLVHRDTVERVEIKLRSALLDLGDHDICYDHDENYDYNHDGQSHNVEQRAHDLTDGCYLDKLQTVLLSFYGRARADDV